MANEELIIEALDEPELDDEGVEIVKAEPAKIITPDEGIEALRKQLDQTREEKRQAEARAAKAEGESYAARTDQNDSEVRLLAASIKDKEYENSILKAAKAEALANGEYDKVADIDIEISTNLDHIGKFRDAHEHYSKRKIEPPQISDPVERFIAEGKLAQVAGDWVRAHPECATNQKAYNKMLGAHHLAISDGLKDNTPEYFAALDRTMGFSKPEANVPDAVSVQAAETPLSSAASEAPRVAPVSRGGGSKTVVTLSRAEREIADMMNMKYEDYAKNKIALEKSGRLGQAH